MHTVHLFKLLIFFEVIHYQWCMIYLVIISSVSIVNCCHYDFHETRRLALFPETFRLLDFVT